MTFFLSVHLPHFDALFAFKFRTAITSSESILKELKLYCRPLVHEEKKEKKSIHDKEQTFLPKYNI